MGSGKLTCSLEPWVFYLSSTSQTFFSLSLPVHVELYKSGCLDGRASISTRSAPAPGSSRYWFKKTFLISYGKVVWYMLVMKLALKSLAQCLCLPAFQPIRSGSKSVNVAPTIEPWFSENWPSCRGYVCLQLFCIKHSHRLAQFNVALQTWPYHKPNAAIKRTKNQGNFFFRWMLVFSGCIYPQIKHLCIRLHPSTASRTLSDVPALAAVRHTETGVKKMSTYQTRMLSFPFKVVVP